MLHFDAQLSPRNSLREIFFAFFGAVSWATSEKIEGKGKKQSFTHYNLCGADENAVDLFAQILFAPGGSR